MSILHTVGERLKQETYRISEQLNSKSHPQVIWYPFTMNKFLTRTKIIYPTVNIDLITAYHSRVYSVLPRSQNRPLFWPTDFDILTIIWNIYRLVDRRRFILMSIKYKFIDLLESRGSEPIVLKIWFCGCYDPSASSMLSISWRRYKARSGW